MKNTHSYLPSIGFSMLGLLTLTFYLFTGVGLAYHSAFFCLLSTVILLGLELTSQKMRQRPHLTSIMAPTLWAVMLVGGCLFLWLVDPTPLSAELSFLTPASAFLLTLTSLTLTTWCEKNNSWPYPLTAHLGWCLTIHFLSLTATSSLFAISPTLFEHLPRFLTFVEIGFLLWFGGQLFFSLLSFCANKNNNPPCFYLTPSKAKQRSQGIEASSGWSAYGVWFFSYLRKAVPVTLIGSALIAWYATGFISVGADEQAAVYRLGKLTPDSILKPGIHLIWPRPFDRAVIVKTTQIRTSTLGYIPDEGQDFLWAQNHSREEDQLPLGDGNEVICANLKIQWHIDDLYRFLTSYNEPEKRLLAEGYHLLLEQTRGKSLDRLLNENRATLTQFMTDRLRQWATESHSGISVDGVVMESLHPPIQLGKVYQSVISAEINKTTSKRSAQGQLEASKALAEADSQGAILTAQIDAFEKKGDAVSEATEFNAAVDADHFSGYRFTRKMKTLEDLLPSRHIVILGKNVDPARLYFKGADLFSEFTPNPSTTFNDPDLNTQIQNDQPSVSNVEPKDQWAQQITSTPEQEPLQQETGQAKPITEEQQPENNEQLPQMDFSSEDQS